MTHLLAAEGAKFSGVIEKINSDFRAYYEVSLDEGAQLEADLCMFPTKASARTWLDAAAFARGFATYDLSTD
jgi:hypothetical protein